MKITLFRLFVIESESRSVVSDSLLPHGLYSPWNSPGQNTGVGSVSLFWGIFPTQGSNLGVLHCRQILYQLSHKGSPRILEWVVTGCCWKPRVMLGFVTSKGEDFHLGSEMRFDYLEHFV